MQDNKYISDNRLLLKRINEFCKLKKSQDTEILHQITKFVEGNEEVNKSRNSKSNNNKRGGRR